MAVKVPLGDHEVEDLARQVGQLLTDRKRLDEMSEAARRFVATEHDPARAAQAMVEACRDLEGFHPLPERVPNPKPPTTLVWREVAADLTVHGADASLARRRKQVVEDSIDQSWTGSLVAYPERHGWPDGTRSLGATIPGHKRGRQAGSDVPRPLEPGDSFDWEATVRRPGGGLDDRGRAASEKRRRF